MATTKSAKKIEPIQAPADWLPPLTPAQALVLRAFRAKSRHTVNGGPWLTLEEIRKRAREANPRGVNEVLNNLVWKKYLRFHPTFGFGGEVTWSLTDLGQRVLDDLAKTKGKTKGKK